MNSNFAFEMASIVQQYPSKVLEKMKDYQVKLYSDEKRKPVLVPPRSVPYHLQARVADSLENMIKNPTHVKKVGHISEFLFGIY